MDILSKASELPSMEFNRVLSDSVVAAYEELPEDQKKIIGQLADEITDYRRGLGRISGLQIIVAVAHYMKEEK